MRIKVEMEFRNTEMIGGEVHDKVHIKDVKICEGFRWKKRMNTDL